MVKKNCVDLILASFQKYVDSHMTQSQSSYSKDSLSQLSTFFQSQLGILENTVKHLCLPLIIGICQGYRLKDFLNNFLVGCQLKRLNQQLSKLFNQLSSKRICYQLSHLRTLLTQSSAQCSQELQAVTQKFNKSSQPSSGSGIADLSEHIISKFNW